MRLLTFNSLIMFDIVFVFFLFLVGVTCLMYYIPGTNRRRFDDDLSLDEFPAPEGLSASASAGCLQFEGAAPRTRNAATMTTLKDLTVPAPPLTCYVTVNSSILSENTPLDHV